MVQPNSCSPCLRSRGDARESCPHWGGLSAEQDLSAPLNVSFSDPDLSCGRPNPGEAWSLCTNCINTCSPHEAADVCRQPTLLPRQPPCSMHTSGSALASMPCLVALRFATTCSRFPGRPFLRQVACSRGRELMSQCLCLFFHPGQGGLTRKALWGASFKYQSPDGSMTYRVTGPHLSISDSNCTCY